MGTQSQNLSDELVKYDAVVASVLSKIERQYMELEHSASGLVVHGGARD